MRDGSTMIGGGTYSEFVGIYSGRIHKDSDLGMIWKARAIAQLISHIENEDIPEEAPRSFYTASTITTGGTLKW